MRFLSVFLVLAFPGLASAQSFLGFGHGDNCHPSRQAMAFTKPDFDYARKHYRQFMEMSQSSDLLLKALDNPDPRIRYAAIFAAADQGRPFNGKFVEKVGGDSDPHVRQAARRALMMSSANILSPGWSGEKSAKKRAKTPHVDFGPMPCTGVVEAAGSAALWRDWLAEQGTGSSTSERSRK